MSSKAFLDLVKARRSYYNILPRSLIEPSAIKNIIDQAVLHTPSTYNTQGGRVVLLLGEAHRQAWSVVREHTMAWLQGNEEMIKMHSAKIDGYANGYGTVMFLEDEETIEASYKRSPQFRDLGLFDKWAQDSNAMMQ
jgi:predicted oxidoreductase (fatty acid repression mutant protein)